MERPERKPVRLNGYDYSRAGAYFVTICTQNRKPVLSTIVGEGLCALPQIQFTSIGVEVVKSIEYINSHYATVAIEKYVVMPNHVHLLLRIDPAGGRGGPPLQRIIQQIKSYTTHQYGGVLWQRSYYDHVIRGEEDYRSIWQYIDENPLKWRLDELYIP